MYNPAPHCNIAKDWFLLLHLQVPEYQADFDEQEAKEDKFKLQKALKVKVNISRAPFSALKVTS